MANLKDIITSIRNKLNIQSWDEAKTKNAIILPILSALNWNIHDVDEVEPEYGVSGRRVDYVLRIGDDKLCFIEAKRISADLNNDVIQHQLLNYAFKEGVELAILTSGIVWMFYLPLTKGDWGHRNFCTLDLLQYDIDTISNTLNSLLLKDNLESGYSKLYAEEILDTKAKFDQGEKNIPPALHELFKNTDKRLLALVQDSLFKMCGIKPDTTQVLEFINEVKGISKPKSVRRLFKSNQQTGPDASIGSKDLESDTNHEKNHKKDTQSGKNPSWIVEQPIATEDIVKLDGVGNVSIKEKDTFCRNAQNITVEDIDIWNFGNAVFFRWTDPETKEKCNKSVPYEQQIRLSDNKIYELEDYGARYKNGFGICNQDKLRPAIAKFIEIYGDWGKYALAWCVGAAMIKHLKEKPACVLPVLYLSGGTEKNMTDFAGLLVTLFGLHGEYAQYFFKENPSNSGSVTSIEESMKQMHGIPFIFELTGHTSGNSQMLWTKMSSIYMGVSCNKTGGKPTKEDKVRFGDWIKIAYGELTTTAIFMGAEPPPNEEIIKNIARIDFRQFEMIDHDEVSKLNDNRKDLSSFILEVLKDVYPQEIFDEIDNSTYDIGNLIKTAGGRGSSDVKTSILIYTIYQHLVKNKWFSDTMPISWWTSSVKILKENSQDISVTNQLLNVAMSLSGKIIDGIPMNNFIHIRHFNYSKIMFVHIYFDPAKVFETIICKTYNAFAHVQRKRPEEIRKLIHSHSQRWGKKYYNYSFYPVNVYANEYSPDDGKYNSNGTWYTDPGCINPVEDKAVTKSACRFVLPIKELE